MPSDTLAARHLAVLRAAVVRDRTLHDAVEWVAELIGYLDLCECCGLPPAPCTCAPCDNCGRATDNPPSNKYPNESYVCNDCREDLQ